MHEFIYALAFISVSAKKTISIGVPTELVRGDVFRWGPLMAGALIASLPVAVIYTFLPGSLITGFTMAQSRGKTPAARVAPITMESDLQAIFARSWESLSGCL